MEDYTVNISSVAKGTEAEISDAQISIYPNPVSGDILNITAVENNTTYRIINMLGQEIEKGVVNSGAVSVATLKTGTYLLEITANATTFVKRFIKN